MSNAVDRLASRKWILAASSVILTFAARGLGWIDGLQFVELIQWLVGLYMAGNIGSAVASRLSITTKEP